MSDQATTTHRAETIERRAAILRAAADAFGTKGFAKGTLAEIAEVVGMTRAGVLHHFGSKDQLLVEVLAFRDQAEVEHLTEHRMPLGMDFFLHLIDTAHHNAHQRGIVQAFTVLSADSITADNPGREFFEGRYASLRREGATALQRICDEHGVSPRGDLEEIAASVLATMDGLQTQWLLDPDAIDLGGVTERTIRVLVEAATGVPVPERGAR